MGTKNNQLTTMEVELVATATITIITLTKLAHTPTNSMEPPASTLTTSQQPATIPSTTTAESNQFNNILVLNITEPTLVLLMMV